MTKAKGIRDTRRKTVASALHRPRGCSSSVTPCGTNREPIFVIRVTQQHGKELGSQKTTRPSRSAIVASSYDSKLAIERFFNQVLAPEPNLLDDFEDDTDFS